MGRPNGTNNIMRTPEEKEKLVLEYLNSKVGYRRFAENNDVYPSIFFKWIHQYRENEIEGLKSKTGKHNNPKCGRYNRNKSEIEKLKEELFIDFDLKHSKDVPNLIKLYIDYYNYERT